MMIVICLLVLGVGFAILGYVLENKERIGLSMLVAIVSACLIVAFILTGASTLHTYCAHETTCYEVQATRAILEDELMKYDEMRPGDMGASTVYLEVREKVIDFNKKVIYAKEHNNIWFNYLFSIPAYLTVDTISLQVG